MIVMHVAQLVINIVHALFNGVLNPFYTFLMNLGTTISALQVPAIIYSTLSFCAYFLPMSTISYLFGITFILVIISILVSFVYTVLHFVKQLPLL